jgi:hypothetical protein
MPSARKPTTAIDTKDRTVFEPFIENAPWKNVI